MLSHDSTSTDDVDAWMRDKTPGDQPYYQAMAIVFDFDGTISTRDTIAVLGAYAVSKHGQPDDWDTIVSAYSADYAKYVAEYSPQAVSRTTVEQEMAFLSGLRSIEVESLKRVQDAGLFRDITPEEFRQLGEEAVKKSDVQIRRGFSELLSLVRRQSWRKAVISINWSEDFIRGCTGSDAADLDIVANFVEYPTGRVRSRQPGSQDENRQPLLTSHDKHMALQSLVEPGGYLPKDFIYIGDSVTDIECLLAAKGIVIADDGDSRLVRTLDRLGYTVPHVTTCGPDFKLSWARDFKEILESGILSV
jgi:2-hydroxy-3-keto-5-methylthiopentenyl-1-phosphate phosphatase